MKQRGAKSGRIELDWMDGWMDLWVGRSIEDISVLITNKKIRKVIKVMSSVFYLLFEKLGDARVVASHLGDTNHLQC